MDDLVSIVVPIYNVELYLEKCLESLINQSYSNLEIILVNDGSTDNCLEICKKYKEKDDRIIVIDKENGGLSDARNCGLHKCRGKYVCFIDSDDYINKNYVECLHKAIELNDSDISICKYRMVTDNEDNNEDVYYSSDMITNYDGKDLTKIIYSDKGKDISFVAWNKLYRVELFKKNNITYPKGKIHEDTQTTFKLIYYSSKISVYNEVLYYYRIRNNSIINQKYTKKKCIDFIDAMIAPVEFYSTKEEFALCSLAYNYACKQLISFSKKINSIDKKEQTEIKSYLMNRYIYLIERYRKDIKIKKINSIFFKLFFMKSKIFWRNK